MTKYSVINAFIFYMNMSRMSLKKIIISLSYSYIIIPTE